MAMNFGEEAEKRILFRQRTADNSGNIFNTAGSAGRNALRLAKILSTFDFVINLLGWQEKPLANLPKFLTQYQASVDAKYHNDYKEVLIAEEITRRQIERKGINISNVGDNK